VSENTVTIAPPSNTGRGHGRINQVKLGERWATPITVFGLVVIVQIASMFAPPYILPSPLAILQTLYGVLTTELLDVSATLARLMIALLCSLVLGTLLGVIMGMVAPVRPYLRSLIVIDTGIPAVSWILVAVFWFKNPEHRIFFILLVILVPFYALNILDGIRAMPKDWLEMYQCFRPTRWQVFRHLIYPHIVPYMLMTTKSVFGYATRMIIFAELIGAAVGAGARMGMAQATFRMDEVLAWTVLLVAFTLVAQYAVELLETRMLKWRPEAEMR
jgi:NitT/TauT family transport system permease protein